jgi:hypothetical protein
MAQIEFNAEFINRRMELHRRMQQEAVHKLVEEIIEEAQALPRRKPKTAELFEEDFPTYESFESCATL